MKPADRSKRSRRRRPPRHRQGYRAIEEWVRQRLRAELGDSLPKGTDLPDIDIKLELPLRFRGRERELGERRFVNAIERALSDFVACYRQEERGFQDGHVYCHWCSAAVCEHSQPTDPRQVFVGYEPTGKPQWRDFRSWVVERRDERMDRLFEGRPMPLALAVTGNELVRDLLPEFGGALYWLVGQLTCGPFVLPRTETGEESLALSMQLVERRSATRPVSYDLNVVCAVPAPHHLPTLIEHRISPLLSSWVHGIRAELRELDQRMLEALRRGETYSLKRCRALARELLERAPQKLEKFLRQKGRRTQHAEQRSRDPERPTSSAMEDAQRAKDDDLFWDTKEGTVLVRGPRNRIHVFRPDGVHITSVRYPGETVQARLRSRRWKKLSADIRAQVRSAWGG